MNKLVAKKVNKAAFAAKELKNGWQVTLWVGGKACPIINFRFKTMEDVRKALRSKVVFIHKKK